MRRIHVFALLAGLAGAFIPVVGFAAPPESVFLLRHGSVVDSARGAAYVAKPPAH